MRWTWASPPSPSDGVTTANAAALRPYRQSPGICVVSAVMAADDPTTAADDLHTLFTHTDRKDPA
jgi:thiamine monophosphate synthase